MRRVAQRGSKPEMVVRRALHASGKRFRLHRRGLPGSPDIVFPARRAVVFVHGCFWHKHLNHPGRWSRTFGLKYPLHIHAQVDGALGQGKRR
jgi:DNA mismatch endonuclease (patch repair protein)